jgi:tight adherence protein C
MSLGIAYVPIALLTATAGAAFTLLCARTHSQRNRERTDTPVLPLGFRLCQGPALLLSPLISHLISRRMERIALRLLDAAALNPPLTPALWFATRSVHGLCAALLVLIIGGVDAWIAATLTGICGFMVGRFWLRRKNLARDLQITRELPAYLDLLTVCVEAGATLTAGVRLIVAQAPQGPLRNYFERVLREVRSGRPRAQAFAYVAGLQGVESLTTLANALAHAEAAGMSLGQILRTQSEQRTAERFARAERLAMQAPVKMLGPLIFCIFPCTFIVLAVPIVVRMLEVFRS